MEPGSWLPITHKARLEDIFVIYGFDDSLDASMKAHMVRILNQILK
jgi:hypothetical protein